MSRSRVHPVAVLAVILMAAGILSASAQDATPTVQVATPTAQDATPTTGPSIVAPGTEALGATPGEWAARWWQWSLSFPTVVNPGVDFTGAACGLGQHGPVFFLTTSTLDSAGLTRACTVPEGVAILVPVIGADCSTAEAAPYHGTDQASLSSCAKALVDGITAAVLNVDGTDVPDLASYRTQTPVFNVILPPGNWLDAPAGPASVLADGVYVLIEPLAVGSHTITFGGTYPNGASLAATYDITVAAAPVPTG